MADQFGLTDDMYLSDDQRGLAADLSRAFDNSRDIQERSMARYGLPALSNYEKDWAIERARTMADRTNRMRMARNGHGGAGGGAGGGGGGGGGSGYGRYPNTQSNQRNSIGGMMQLLPLLLGRDGYGQLLKDGVIKYVKDAWGNLTAQPGENYRDWLDKNSFTTAEGNTAIVGEDGSLRVVDPNTGELLETVGKNDWSYDKDGNVDFNSDVFGADNNYNEMDTGVNWDGTTGNYGSGSDTSSGSSDSSGDYGGGDYSGGDDGGGWDWGGGDSGGGDWSWGW